MIFDLFGSQSICDLRYLERDTARYWNTTSLRGPELTDRKQRAQAQADAILALYRQHRQLSPWQVYELLGGKWPITSCRRAITNLCDAGALVKLNVRRRGKEGATEFVWSLPQDSAAA